MFRAWGCRRTVKFLVSTFTGSIPYDIDFGNSYLWLMEEPLLRFPIQKKVFIPNFMPFLCSYLNLKR